MMDLFPPLPPHVDKLDPRTLRWEVDRVQTYLQAQADQPTHFEQLQTIPWDKIVVPLVLLIGVMAGWIKADVVSGLLGR